MAKLGTLKPRLGGLKPRLAGPSREVRERDRLATRETAVDWRPWYKLPRWQALRQKVLVRDRFTCRKTGVLLTGKAPAADSPVAHHAIPHNGDPALFWDEDNVITVSKAWHDSVAQAREHADRVAAIHPKWLRPSVIPLTIVCGAPASGKSTYVSEHAGPADLVIDLDVIASDICGSSLHGWSAAYLHAALYRRNDILGSLSRPSAYPAAWFIVAEPKAEHRAWWHQALKPASIVVLETPEAQCIVNAASDPDRDQKRTADAIVKWWFEYQRRPGEVVVSPGP